MNIFICSKNEKSISMSTDLRVSLQHIISYNITFRTVDNFYIFLIFYNVVSKIFWIHEYLSFKQHIIYSKNICVTILSN